MVLEAIKDTEKLVKKLKKLTLSDSFSDNILKILEPVKSFYNKNYDKFLIFVEWHATLISLLQLISTPITEEGIGGPYRISKK